jgi:hypothetical protein
MFFHFSDFADAAVAGLSDVSFGCDRLGFF